MNWNMFLVNSGSKLRLKQTVVPIMFEFISHNRLMCSLKRLDNPPVFSPPNLNKQRNNFASMTASDCCRIKGDLAFCESTLIFYLCFVMPYHDSKQTAHANPVSLQKTYKPEVAAAFLASLRGKSTVWSHYCGLSFYVRPPVVYTSGWGGLTLHLLYSCGFMFAS